MKKYIVIIGLILGVTCSAQNKNNFPQSDFLAQFGKYFDKAELNENNIICLHAKESYTDLQASQKSQTMKLVLAKTDYALAMVEYGYKKELWGKDTVSNEVKLLDSWNLNSPYIPKSTLKTLKKTNEHPFFQYYGMSGFFSEEQTNFYLSTHAGWFLYKNRWDVALSYSVGISGSGENFVTNNELGLMSKVYFPIRKYNIAPYAGLGISFSWIYEPFSYTWNLPVYLGVSWYVGPGSLDCGFQISDNTIFTAGYTLSLQLPR